MKNSIRVVLNTLKLEYDFTINRNITMITGDSSSGKTSFVKTLVAFNAELDPTVQLTCDVPCIAIESSTPPAQIKQIIQSTRNSLVFIDEGVKYLKNDEFSKLINKTTNYYVIFSRTPFQTLTCSYKEFYSLKTIDNKVCLERNYDFPNDVFSTFTGDVPARCAVLPEDKVGGFEALSSIFSITVIPGGGKSYFEYALKHILTGVKLCVIFLDGAAFGSHMVKLLDTIKLYTTKGVQFIVILQESFEYMLLKSQVICNSFDFENVSVDSRKYLSWERYFTDVVSKHLEPYGILYKKSVNVLEVFPESKFRLCKYLTQCCPQLEPFLYLLPDTSSDTPSVLDLF